MAFTQDQVNQAYRDSLAQGFSAEDIAKGAGNLGIDPYMLQLAATASTPAPSGIPQGTNPAYASGYGGYQPEGSPYYGDNPMPQEYMQQLPQMDANTNGLINAAINMAVQQNLANGYAADTGGMVARLRGYYEGGNKSEALQAATSMLNSFAPNGSGLTQENGVWKSPFVHTNDYGYGGILGSTSGLNTNEYDFGASSASPTGAASSSGGGNYGGGGNTAPVGGGGARSTQTWNMTAQPMQQQSQVNLQAYQKNPYLDEMAQGIRRQVTNNLTETVLPGVRANAIASGGFGGSRQGVAEGLAIGRTNDALSSALANLYGSDYQAQMNRNLQQYGIDNQTSLGWAANALGNKQADNSFFLGNKQADNSYNLGMGNLGLGYANLDRNINNDNNSWALQGANLLNSTWNQLNSNNAGAINAGGNIQNTPINYWQQFGNQANAFGQGYGTSTQGTSAQGSPLLGAAGGWQLGSQLGNMFGNSNASNYWQGSAGGLSGYEDFGRSTGGNGAWL